MVAVSPSGIFSNIKLSIANIRNKNCCRKSAFVTQPAISLAIRELEAEFGITLFTRFNNRLTLTEDGALFYKKADYILQYCKDMQFELNGSRIQQNPIHVGIPPVLSSFFFPGLIDAYRSKYPDALVSLEEYGSVRACDLVQEDKLDLALVKHGNVQY